MSRRREEIELRLALEASRSNTQADSAFSSSSRPAGRDAPASTVYSEEFTHQSSLIPWSGPPGHPQPPPMIHDDENDVVGDSEEEREGDDLESAYSVSPQGYLPTPSSRLEPFTETISSFSAPTPHLPRDQYTKSSTIINTTEATSAESIAPSSIIYDASTITATATSKKSAAPIPSSAVVEEGQTSATGKKRPQPISRKILPPSSPEIKPKDPTSKPKVSMKKKILRIDSDDDENEAPDRLPQKRLASKSALVSDTEDVIELMSSFSTPAEDWATIEKSEPSRSPAEDSSPEKSAPAPALPRKRQRKRKVPFGAEVEEVLPEKKGGGQDEDDQLMLVVDLYQEQAERTPWDPEGDDDYGSHKQKKGKKTKALPKEKKSKALAKEKKPSKGKAVEKEATIAAGEPRRNIMASQIVDESDDGDVLNITSSTSVPIPGAPKRSIPSGISDPSIFNPLPESATTTATSCKVTSRICRKSGTSLSASPVQQSSTTKSAASSSKRKSPAGNNHNLDSSDEDEDVAPIQKRQKKTSSNKKAVVDIDEEEDETPIVPHRIPSKKRFIDEDDEDEDEDDDNDGDEDELAPVTKSTRSKLKSISPQKPVLNRKKRDSISIVADKGKGKAVVSTPSTKTSKSINDELVLQIRNSSSPPQADLSISPKQLTSKKDGSTSQTGPVADLAGKIAVGAASGSAVKPSFGFAYEGPSLSLSSILSKTGGARLRGLSRKTKLPSLHSTIRTPPKKLAAPPVVKKKPRKGDVGEDDMSEGEWEEYQKEREKQEMLMLWD